LDASPKVVHVQENDEVDDDTAINVVKHSKKPKLDKSAQAEVIKDATKSLEKKHSKHIKKEEQKKG
jgi:hypothetical protein